MIDPHEYNISIRKIVSVDETYFEAKVKEFPDVAEYADTHTEAYELVIDTIETTAKIFSEKKKEMPCPEKIDDDYSGRFMLRIPKSLHGRLARSAADEGISLNQNIIKVLSYSLGVIDGLSTRNALEVWITLEKISLKNNITARAVKKGHAKIILDKPVRTDGSWSGKKTA